jgi:hypothetical protein
MRKFLVIFCAILAYLALSSKSCSSDEKEDAANKEAEVVKTRASIRNEFESEDLSRKSLRAFEAKAKQDLKDLSDYLHIYSDKQLDESFKNQVRGMIMEMFISDTIRISNRLSGQTELKNISLFEFLTLDLAPNFISMDFIFDSIRVTAPLHKTDDLKYKGCLSFSRRLKAISASDTVFTSPARMEADMFVSKVFKPFGTDTLLVWNVFLGDIH